MLGELRSAIWHLFQNACRLFTFIYIQTRAVRIDSPGRPFEERFFERISVWINLDSTMLNSLSLDFIFPNHLVYFGWSRPLSRIRIVHNVHIRR